MAQLAPAVGDHDHIQSDSQTALITLIEYGDYECSSCGRAYPIVKHVQAVLGENLRFVFRNFPLATLHPHAQNAAEAAEIAGTAGKFWEMHDLLYENQSALDDHHLVQYAESLGIDRTQFLHELETHAQEPRVREDFLSGAKSGVNGTPTFFINGERYDGRWEHGSLLRALEEIIDNSRI